MTENAGKVLRERRRLYQKEGRDPSPADIAARMGVPVARVEQVLSMVQQPTSLDAPVGEDGDATLGDLIKAPDAVDPQAAAEASALQKIVGEALADSDPAGATHSAHAFRHRRTQPTIPLKRSGKNSV